MTQFLECLQREVDAKNLKKSQLKLAKARFDNFLAENIEAGMPGPEAAAKAAEDATKYFDIENREAQRRKLAQVYAGVKIWRELNGYKGKDKHKAWRNLFDMYDNQGQIANYAAIKDAVQGDLQTYITSILEKFKPRGAGTIRPRAGQEETLREIFGEATGDAEAKGFAEAFRRMNKAAVEMFRMVGGSLNERADWNLPQKQDYAKLHGKKDEWVENHMRWVDWNRVRREDGSRISPDQRVHFLRHAYDAIRSEGAVSEELGSALGIRNMGNKLPLHRILVYKNADAWLEMHAAYGSGSIYDVLVGHMSDMAHEIAMVKRFGPNPQIMMKNIETMNRKLAAKAGDVGKASDENDAMARTFATVNREVGLAQSNGIGNFMAGVRNILTSAFLGSASLVAIPSDLAMASIAKNYNRLDGMRFMSRYLSLMNPANAADRQLAVRLGLIAEHAVAQAYGARRMLGFDIAGPSATRRIVDVTMNLSLMTPHTQMARWAFGMEFLGLMADSAGKGFDELPFKDMLTRHGITAEDWNKLRKVPLFEERGATFLRPMDYLKLDKSAAGLDLAQKFQTMLVDESKFAVPDVNLHSRRILLGDTKPGSLLGEAARSLAMFKNFPLTFTNVIMRRYLTDALVDGRQAGYAAAMVLSMSAIGALRVQLGQISQGHDPQDMANPDFVLRSLLTGGGLGIYGDFLFQDHNRYGMGIAATVAGPVVGALGDTLKFTAGNLQEILDGKDPKILKDLAELSERYTPGSTIWYLRLTQERLLWDQLQKMVDPGFEDKVKRAEKRRLKDHGQQSWWGAGQLRPSRAPELGSALQ